MIALGSLVHHRSDVAKYLERDKEDPDRSRAAYVRGINLGTDDPYLAVKIMEALSDVHKKSSRPAYHLAVSFGARDAVGLSYAKMETVARYLMEKLDIADHYAVLVAHEDRKHAHFHLLIDRRNPGTQRLWKNPTWRQIHYVCRLAERHFGLEESPSHLAKLPDQEWPSRDRTVPIGARRARFRKLEEINSNLLGNQGRSLTLEEEPFLLRARAVLKPYFRDWMPATWSQLEQDLDSLGYRLVRKERGLAISDLAGVEGAAASSVSRYASLGKLEQRFEIAYDVYARHRDSSGLELVSLSDGPQRGQLGVRSDGHGVPGMAATAARDAGSAIANHVPVVADRGDMTGSSTDESAASSTPLSDIDLPGAPPNPVEEPFKKQSVLDELPLETQQLIQRVIELYGLEQERSELLEAIESIRSWLRHIRESISEFVDAGEDFEYEMRRLYGANAKQAIIKFHELRLAHGNEAACLMLESEPDRIAPMIATRYGSTNRTHPQGLQQLTTNAAHAARGAIEAARKHRELVGRVHEHLGLGAKVAARDLEKRLIRDISTARAKANEIASRIQDLDPEVSRLHAARAISSIAPHQQAELLEGLPVLQKLKPLRELRPKPRNRRSTGLSM